MNHTLKALAAIVLTSGIAAADTTQTAPSVYEVDAGVTFTLLNFGSSNFLLSWTDSSGTFENIVDPTLILTAGETYTFINQTAVHPFIVTDTSLPVNGVDGSYFRTTASGSTMDAATLQPIADFTSNPGGNDPIVWALTDNDAGDYWYTCRVTGHLDMTGRIEVVEGVQACPADLNGDGDLNFFDVSAFLAAFAAMDPIADFSKDGNFNFFDVAAFLSAFTAGCP